MLGAFGMTLVIGCTEMSSGGAQTIAIKPTPAQAHTIHVMVPHK